MTRRQAKKVHRLWLRATPYDEKGRALPPYHSLYQGRKTTMRRAMRIIGRLELRYWDKGMRWKWNPYDLGDHDFALCADG